MTDLTAGSPWEWRVTRDGEAGPWAGSLAAAARPFHAPRRRLPQAIRWTLFGERLRRIDLTRSYRVADDRLPESLRQPSPPARLERPGASYPGRPLELPGSPCDLSVLLGPPRNHRECFLHGVLVLPVATDLILHLSADWWMQWWCDGQPVCDTLGRGNQAPLRGRAHEVRLQLAAGRHVLVGRVQSGNGGWGLALAATCGCDLASATWSVEVRRRFRVARPARFAGLVYAGEASCRPSLNGDALSPPDRDLVYDRVPGLPAGLLRPGWNELHHRWSEEDSAAGLAMLGVPIFTGSGVRRRLAMRGRLLGIAPAAAGFRGVPVVGWCSAEACALSCRTEVRQPVTLRVGGRCWSSPPGLEHRFVADRLPGDRALAYELRAGRGRRFTGRLRTIAAAPFTLGLISDPSPCPGILRRAAEACAAARPDAALLLGDLVSDGGSETKWVEEFTRPARRLCSRRPTFAVIGNHDEDAWLFDHLIQAPGGARQWQARLGPLHLLGLDGMQDWSADSANARWLDATLAVSDAPFVLVCNHYPAWSSTPHGACGEDGRPRERMVREAREVILPVCARHRVTAYLNGHAHCYERSEPPGQPPQITSGGAGGFLYLGSARANPHRRVFVAAHHYCLLRVEDSRLLLEARDLRHRRLDRVIWKPRSRQT